MIIPKEYCPHCGKVTESKLYSICGGTQVNCAECHRYIEVIWDDEDDEQF